MTYIDRPPRLTALTAYLLSQVAKVAKHGLDDELSSRGMRLRHMAVLAAVEEAASSQLDLARRLLLDPSDVTSTVDDLEGRGFVKRTVDATDRRRKLVSLTAAGRRELDRLDALARGIVDTLFEPLPERRRQALHQDLRQVLVAYDERQAAGE